MKHELVLASGNHETAPVFAMERVTGYGLVDIVKHQVELQQRQCAVNCGLTACLSSGEVETATVIISECPTCENGAVAFSSILERLAGHCVEAAEQAQRAKQRIVTQAEERIEQILGPARAQAQAVRATAEIEARVAEIRIYHQYSQEVPTKIVG